MTTLLFYKNIVALDREQHKSLKIRPARHMKFAGEATVLPIVVGEFFEIARQCPIAFLRLEDQSLLPVALVGLPGGKNLYLDEKGQWNAPYVPAYVRRYPFVFAETGPDQLTLCIDHDYEGFNEKEGVALFEEGGKPSALVQGALDMLSEYQRQSALTQAFVQRLQAADILIQANANASLSDGRSLSLQGLLVVDDKKFRAIPEGTLKDWFASGDLGLVYAHLMSMGNLLELLRRQPDPSRGARGSVH